MIIILLISYAVSLFGINVQQIDDKIFKYNNDIIAIELKDTTDYLLKLKDGYVLIDTGYKSDLSQFETALNKLHITYNDIKYLIITHAHSDHIGFAWYLHNEKGIPIIAHETCFKHLSQQHIDDIKLEDLEYANPFFNAMVNIFANFVEEEDIQPIIQNEADIAITSFPYNLSYLLPNTKIIYTPGHSDDSISILLANNDIICGDVMINILHFLGSDYRPVVMTSFEQLLQTWEVMDGYNPSTIYPAHGKPFEGETLDGLLKKYKHR
jgi:glyoxylase-like metal-dependent hydrolase (beta-lactamase superfamily II)